MPEGFNVVKVAVSEVPIEHSVQVGKFNEWVRQQGRSPREIMDRQRVREILGIADSRQLLARCGQQEDIRLGALRLRLARTFRFPRKSSVRAEPSGCINVPASGHSPTTEKRGSMAKKDGTNDAVYKLVEVIGTSTQSWEDAAKNAVETAARTLRDLRIAEVVKMDLKVENGKVVAYRTRVLLSFKYEG